MPADRSITAFRTVLVGLLLAHACAGGGAAAGSGVQPGGRARQAPMAAGPAIFLHAPQALASHKARYAADPQHPEPALARLLDDARKSIAEKPFSITEKSALPPSGDRHDYLSLAPYAWPDPSKPNGLRSEEHTS